MASELAEAQAVGAEAGRERDELAASLAALEAEHANLGDAHAALQCVLSCRASCLKPSQYAGITAQEAACPVSWRADLPRAQMLTHRTRGDHGKAIGAHACLAHSAKVPHVNMGCCNVVESSWFES